MKKEVTPATIGIAVVALLAIIGLVGWKVFGSSSAPQISAATAKARKAAKEGD